MPTTTKEAELIAERVVSTIGLELDITSHDCDISSNDLACEIFKNLVPLAYHTDNYSLRSSLFMVYRVLNPFWEPDYASLCGLVEVYNRDQPEMSPQEYLGLTDDEYASFTDGCHLEGVV